MLTENRRISAVTIENARIIDPFSARDERGTLHIDEGRLVAAAAPNAKIVDGSDWIVAPGLWDIHVHLREPGQEHKETIATGTRAAAAGGFTFVACMPNTQPVIDHPDVVRRVLDAARHVDVCDVGPIAAITQGREGRALTDFVALREAGAVAFSDDGTGVEDDGLMLAAFESVASCGAVLIQHCEYRHLSAGGVMHKGEVSARLGLPGLDPISEEAMIERDIDLCRRTGGRYHVAHISTARAVELVRRAKAENLPVTSEVCPHHLLLTDEACAEADPNTKMHPPLRTSADVAACRAGLRDGTIDCIATDHAPHAESEKSVGFLKAPPGIVGLETALALSADAMQVGGEPDWPRVVDWLTRGPGMVLGMPERPLLEGRPCDLTVIAPDREWVVDPSGFQSKSRNTPFGGRRVRGRAPATVRGVLWHGDFS